MPRENRSETREEELPTRKRRVPLGRNRQRLRVDPKVIPKGKVARWINDEESRLQEAREAGYEFLNDPTATVGEGPEDGRDQMSGFIRTKVGTDRQNNPMYGYLMVIDEALYQADQRDKEKDLDLVEDALRRGADQQGAPGRDGRYIPKDQPIRIDSGVEKPTP